MLRRRYVPPRSVDGKELERKRSRLLCAAARQILDCAVQMLAPGGKLVYSTCTFDRDEDEGTIEYILEKYPQMAVVPQKPEYGFEESRGIEGCLRLFPHRLEGEGHFVALLEKRTEKPDANVKDLENAGEKALSDPLLVEEIEARLCREAEDGKSRQMASGKSERESVWKGKKSGAKPDRRGLFPPV